MTALGTVSNVADPNNSVVEPPSNRHEFVGRIFLEKRGRGGIHANLRCIEASELWDVVIKQHRVTSFSKFRKNTQTNCRWRQNLGPRV